MTFLYFIYVTSLYIAVITHYDDRQQGVLYSVLLVVNEEMDRAQSVHFLSNLLGLQR